MERGMNKVIIVTRKTRLVELIYKYNTLEQAKFYIEHLGADFSDYEKEDKTYRAVVSQATAIVEQYARVQVIDREFIPHMIFGPEDIVVAIGQDGLVANILKYLTVQPLIGINPDSYRWDGVLLPFEVCDLGKVLYKVIEDNYVTKEVTIAKAETKDGQTMLAVNDLFIGQQTHTSARYDIQWNEQTENQSSSGIIVSTGLGSTGWHKSILAQFSAMARALGYEKINTESLAWDDNALDFVVREPFPSNVTQTNIVFGRIDKDDNFSIVSQMPKDGVIFSDGIEADAIEFNSGMEVKIGVADFKGHLVV